jgi:hypothetical protein
MASMNTSDQNVVERPPVEAWQAESLRLTLFRSQPGPIPEQTWWSELVGEDPLEQKVQPRVQTRHEEGTFKKGKLILGIAPDRIDWVYAIDKNREPDAVGIFTIGSFPEALGDFLDRMQFWSKFEACPPARRLAFGAVILQPVASRKEGYRQIRAYLHNVKLDIEHASDLLYQINMPRPSKKTGIEGLTMNRLSVWSVAAFAFAHTRLSRADLSVQHAAGPEFFACRLALDINTAPSFEGELSREQLPLVFQELVDLGKEIAKEGDIP